MDNYIAGTDVKMEHEQEALEWGTNRVKVVGILVYPFKKSHFLNGAQFYKTVVRSTRNSGVYDYIPVMAISPYADLKAGDTVRLEGGVYTHYKPAKFKNVMMYVMIKELEQVAPETQHENEVFLAGDKSCYVDSRLRGTSLGRLICDFVIQKPHRTKGYTYNYYCIAWGKTARYIDCLERGKKIAIKGRFQSRNYYKNDPDTKVDVLVRTYEISVTTMLPIR